MTHYARDTYLADRYGRDQRWVDQRERRLVGELIALLPAPPRRALDAPCGHGRLTDLLRRHAREQVVGADRNLRRLRSAAAAEADQPGAPATFLGLDLAGPLPFAPAAFDLGVCLRLLQHVRSAPERVAILAHLAEACGGRLIASYYATGTLHGLQRRLRAALRSTRRRPLVMLPPATFRAECAQAGLRVTAERPLLPGLHAQRLVLLEPS